MNDVMLDLETLDNTPTAVILSIGAVRMDLDKLTLGDKFQCNLDPRQQPGLTIGADTVMWWLAQSAEARAAVVDAPAFSLSDALQRFTYYLSTAPQEGLQRAKPTLWGNGANFDNVILRNAYKSCGLEAPWPYWNDRCYRTMKALFGGSAIKSITAHNALEDAEQQAAQLLEILRLLRGATRV